MSLFSFFARSTASSSRSCQETGLSANPRTNGLLLSAARFRRGGPPADDASVSSVAGSLLVGRAAPPACCSCAVIIAKDAVGAVGELGFCDYLTNRDGFVGVIAARDLGSGGKPILRSRLKLGRSVLVTGRFCLRSSACPAISAPLSRPHFDVKLRPGFP